MDLLYFQNRYKLNQVFESILKTFRVFEEKGTFDACPSSTREAFNNHDIAFMLATLRFNIEMTASDEKEGIIEVIDLKP